MALRCEGGSKECLGSSGGALHHDDDASTLP